MTRTPHHPIHATDRVRIRELFLRPRPWYRLAEAAEALRMQPEDVRAAIAEGVADAVELEGEIRIPWEEVITLGVLRRWTPRVVSSALPAEQVPELVRSVRKPIQLPRYLWELLAIVAAERTATEEREVTMSDVIEEAVHHALHAQVTSWKSLEERIPGVCTAAVWPLIWDVES
jgi:hypothetical protein